MNKKSISNKVTIQNSNKRGLMTNFDSTFKTTNRNSKSKLSYLKKDKQFEGVVANPAPNSILTLTIRLNDGQRAIVDVQTVLLNPNSPQEFGVRDRRCLLWNDNGTLRLTSADRGSMYFIPFYIAVETDQALKTFEFVLKPQGNSGSNYRITYNYEIF